MEKAIAALPDDLRTAIILRELDGMSYEEIAQTMECPVGTVRSEDLQGARRDQQEGRRTDTLKLGPGPGG